MIGGLARIERILYCSHILERIKKYEDLSKNDLEEIINQYESKSFVKRFFAYAFHNDVDYIAAKAVRNMRALGLEDLKLEKTTVFGLYEELNRLEERAKLISSAS
ncbi:MAG: hypothetical protein AABW50_04290 [Nanoarchaeota archaeon]